jgi:hypothetical protein
VPRTRDQASGALRPSSARDLLDRDPQYADRAYHALCVAVTDERCGSLDAPGLVGELLDCLSSASSTGCARILLLLGILSEPLDPDADPFDNACAGRLAVFDGLERCLQLLPRAALDPPVLLALLYLLAHFPEASDRILGAIGSLPEPDLRTRLRRCLTTPDFGDPATADEAGRAWPSPAVLAFTAEEIASTAPARQALRATEIAASWRSDTLALLAYAGAYAAAVVGEA